MPRDGALTLSDVLSPTLSIVCEPCSRHGRYSVARLVEEYGDAKLTELLQTLASCPKIRPRSFRVRPPDDDELLAVQRLGFTPEASVSRRIAGVDRLRDDAFKAEFACVLQDEFAVAGIVAVVLKA